MSIISAGTTTTTALSSTGNTDGTLQLRVNGTTPSVTLNTLGAIGVGSSPNYGSSGQALVSGGSTTAPTWATVTTSPAGSTGQVQYNNAGSFGAVSSGTSGQVLTSGGSGAAPTWATPAAGGAWTKLSSAAAYDSSAVNFTGFVTSDYDMYAVVVYALNVQSGSFAAFRFYTGGTISTTGYTSSGFYTDSSGNLLARGGNAGGYSTFVQLTNAANLNQSGIVFINANNFNSLSGASQPTINSQIGGGNGTVNTNFFINGSMNTTAAITGIRFYVESGTITGYFDLYGIKR